MSTRRLQTVAPLAWRIEWTTLKGIVMNRLLSTGLSWSCRLLVGDVKTDDTDAFKRALDQAARHCPTPPVWRA